MEKYAHNLVQYAYIYGFDGYNFDFENIDYADRDRLTAFVAYYRIIYINTILKHPSM